MGQQVGTGGRWRDGDARVWFERHLDRPDRFAGYVAEVAEQVVSVAVGLVIDHPPSPTNPGNVRGYVFNVATDPQYRRRGLGSACLAGVLTWFETDTEVRVVDLTATGAGGGMYRAHGFAETGHPSMRLTLRR